MGRDSGALVKAALDFERTAGLFPALAHARDSEVPGGRRACAGGLETPAIVLNVEAQRYLHPLARVCLVRCSMRFSR
jgi:hypothetical protein